MSNNLHVILDAAALTLNDQGFVYLFVGDGKEKGNLMQVAKDRGLTNTLFIPSVPKKEMHEVLAAADACVAILKPIEMYKTTYPNKVFDYMAAAKPVILMIDGVIRKVVEDADCGVFIDPGSPQALADQVSKMRENPQLRQSMGRNGRKYVETHYDRADLAGKMEVIFIRLKEQHE